MIKMIATDVDGTLLRWSFDFSPATKQCIKKLKQNGIKVVLVTGRMHCAALGIAQELGIDTPIVSYQGGMIKEFSKCDDVLFRSDMDAEKAVEIIDWARDNDVHINLYMDDVLYVEEDSVTIRKYTDARFIDYHVCKFDKLKIKNVNKILAIDFQNPERVTGWVNDLTRLYPDLYIIKSTPYFCEIASKEATKGNAVDFLREKWGLKKEEILALGDQDNDIELLKAAGTAVAMGNASDELKAVADYITDTVENDGWVKAVEKFCF